MLDPSQEGNLMSKYKNRKIVWEDITFDSKKELTRYQSLLIREKTGEITGLQRQIKYLLIPKQKGKKRVERSLEYVADFVYLENGELVVEDVKSDYTKKLPLYIAKRKMMLYFHNIEILEI